MSIPLPHGLQCFRLAPSLPMLPHPPSLSPSFSLQEPLALPLQHSTCQSAPGSDMSMLLSAIHCKAAHAARGRIVRYVAGRSALAGARPACTCLVAGSCPGFAISGWPEAKNSRLPGGFSAQPKSPFRGGGCPTLPSPGGCSTGLSPWEIPYFMRVMAVLRLCMLL